MKLNFKYIFAALSLAAVFASCDRRAEFQSAKFITLDHDSYSVDETVGEISIPVHICNPDCRGGVNVSVSIIESTAVAGTDFEVVSPESGVLAFGPNDTTKIVTIKILPHEGVYTGSKAFGVKVASATEGVTVGNTNTASVQIKDIDHPLSMFIGDWTGVYALANGQKLQHTISIVPDSEDPTKLTVENFELYFAVAGGEVAPDANVFNASVNDEKTVLTISEKQDVSANYPGVVIRGFNAPTLQAATGYCDIELHLNSDGTLVMPNGFGCLDAEGWWMYYFGGTVFTKE